VECFQEFTLLKQTNKHPFSGLFPRTTWVSRHQKDKTILDFNEEEMMQWQWHQLDHTHYAPCSRQIIMPAPHHSIFTGQMLFLTPNQQQQSNEGMNSHR